MAQTDFDSNRTNLSQKRGGQKSSFMGFDVTTDDLMIEVVDMPFRMIEVLNYNVCHYTLNF